MSNASVYTENGQQVVRLPDDVRIDGNEVAVKQVGRSLLLVPQDSDPWRLLVDSLEEFTDDYMRDRAQPVGADRGPLFE